MDTGSGLGSTVDKEYILVQFNFLSDIFYWFQVSNMDPDIPYKFNIVNCEKINSQFNFG